MTKLTGSHIPTFWQAQTLRRFTEGWELIIGEHCEAAYRVMVENAGKRKPSKERIYWRKYNPKFNDNPDKGLFPLFPWDTVECESPARKRHHMSHLERYGWVIKSDSDWIITDKGRAAYERFCERFCKR
jgi:hypothetical protein